MKIAVIGGGAAGLTAAVFAKRTNPKAGVTIFESNDRVGRKILSTGNGRCNLTNQNISAENYITHCPEFVSAVLEKFGFDFAEDFFGRIGIPFIIEDGRAYPKSMRAAAVCDALRFEAVRRGVKMEVGRKAEAVVCEKGRFLVFGKVFDRLILACGGKAAPSLGTDGTGFDVARDLGHRVYPLAPALVQLRTENPLKSLKGIRAYGGASAIINGEAVRRERGEIQFTEYGLSGIPLLQLSSLYEKGMEVSVDLFPEKNFTDVLAELTSLADSCGDNSLPIFLGGYIHKNLSLLICKNAKIDPEKNASCFTAREFKAFVSEAKNLKFKIAGTNSWSNAQTTRGGVDLKEINLNMQSKIHGGLYFAGEITDVCGDCGGYNLHWAWATGAAAGESAAKEN